MAHRSFDSVTRFGIPQPPPRAMQPSQGEVYADEGTLILAPSAYEPAPISEIPPPPPSSVRPPISSVRPSMPSWDERAWSIPVGEHTGASSPGARPVAKPKVAARDRSAAAMLVIAAGAMLAALASIGFMHKSNHDAAPAEAMPTGVAAVAATATPAVALPPAPIAPPVAAPAAPEAIDMDDVKPTEAKPAVASAPALAPAAARASAPAQARATSGSAPAAASAPAAGKTKPAAPSGSAQQKALEDLLEQLGEEQLKR